jgi:hypothetical protein
MQYIFQQEKLSIAVGTIDEGSLAGSADALKAMERIYTKAGKKAGWWEIPDDGLEKFDVFSPDFQKMVDIYRGG